MLRSATGCLDFARHDERFTPHKISSHRAHASSKFHREQISLQFGPAVPAPRRSSLVQSVPHIATARRGTARNQFPKSFHNPHPRQNRRLPLPRNERSHLLLERSAGESALLHLNATADPNASPVECLVLTPPTPPRAITL